MISPPPEYLLGVPPRPVAIILICGSDVWTFIQFSHVECVRDFRYEVCRMEVEENKRPPLSSPLLAKDRGDQEAGAAVTVT